MGLLCFGSTDLAVYAGLCSRVDVDVAMMLIQVQRVGETYNSVAGMVTRNVAIS